MQDAAFPGIDKMRRQRHVGRTEPVENMKVIILSFLALTLAGDFAARAQSDMIIKQRAKNLRDANNAQQGVPSDTPPPPPAPAAPPAPPPAAPPPPPSPVEIELKQNLTRLQTDLNAIKPDATNSDEVKLSLERDFSTLAKGSVRPSKASLTKLADDLSAALSASGVTLREEGQLSQAINAIVNSSLITPAQAQTFVVVAQTSLKSSGVSDNNVATITADLKAIIAEIQKSKPKLYQ